MALKRKRAPPQPRVRHPPLTGERAIMICAFDDLCSKLSKTISGAVGTGLRTCTSVNLDYTPETGGTRSAAKDAFRNTHSALPAEYQLEPAITALQLIYRDFHMPSSVAEVKSVRDYGPCELGLFARKDIRREGEVFGAMFLLVGVPTTLQGLDTRMQFKGRGRMASVGCGPAKFVNHSCTPNVEWRFVHSSDTHKVRGCTQQSLWAIKPIAKGEQLFASYGKEYFGKNFARCKCPNHPERVVSLPSASLPSSSSSTSSSQADPLHPDAIIIDDDDSELGGPELVEAPRMAMIIDLTDLEDDEDEDDRDSSGMPAYDDDITFIRHTIVPHTLPRVPIIPKKERYDLVDLTEEAEEDLPEVPELPDASPALPQLPELPELPALQEQYDDNDDYETASTVVSGPSTSRGASTLVNSPVVQPIEDDFEMYDEHDDFFWNPKAPPTPLRHSPAKSSKTSPAPAPQIAAPPVLPRRPIRPVVTFDADAYLKSMEDRWDYNPVPPGTIVYDVE